MIRRFSSIAALSGCLAIAIPAAAQVSVKEPKIKLETLKPGKIELDPRLGYVLVRMGPKATPNDRPIAVVFQRIDGTTNKLIKFEAGAQSLSNFLRTTVVAVNTGRSFGDKDGVGTYVVKAYPGKWAVSAVETTCLSMGTYSFEVRQGEIADIGTLLTARENGLSLAPELKEAKLSQDLIDFGTMMNIVMTATLFAKPATDDPVLPAPLQALPRHKATLGADYRSDNSCLGMFSRAASLPPVGHQPPMTAEAAAVALARINPEELVKRKKEKAEKAKLSAAAAKQ